MLESIKKPSLLTKILYVVAFILFVIWVIPTISSYYTKISSYEKNLKELKNMADKQGIAIDTQKFSERSFKQDSKAIFSKVDITNIGGNLYKINMKMKKENLKNFNTFIKTISLRYYVEIQRDLEFKSKDGIIYIKMILKVF